MNGIVKENAALIDTRAGSLSYNRLDMQISQTLHMAIELYPNLNYLFVLDHYDDIALFDNDIAPEIVSYYQMKTHEEEMGSFLQHEHPQITLDSVKTIYCTMMDFFKSSVTRFPFVVDSPRAKEASLTSSKDILKMISQLKMLPQIILATIDFERFKDDVETPTTVITLTEQRKLLCESDYSNNANYIMAMVELLKNS